MPTLPSEKGNSWPEEGEVVSWPEACDGHASREKRRNRHPVRLNSRRRDDEEEFRATVDDDCRGDIKFEGRLGSGSSRRCKRAVQIARIKSSSWVATTKI